MLRQFQGTAVGAPGDADCQHKVLLLSLEKSPTGMTLTCANHVVLMHPMVADTSALAAGYERQAIGRVRRPGQQKTIHIWRFVTNDTVEERITEANRALYEDTDAAPAPAPAPGAGAQDSEEVAADQDMGEEAAREVAVAQDSEEVAADRDMGEEAAGEAVVAQDAEEAAADEEMAQEPVGEPGEEAAPEAEATGDGGEEEEEAVAADVGMVQAEEATDGDAEEAIAEAGMKSLDAEASEASSSRQAHDAYDGDEAEGAEPAAKKQRTSMASVAVPLEVNAGVGTEAEADSGLVTLLQEAINTPQFQALLTRLASSEEGAGPSSFAQRLAINCERLVLLGNRERHAQEGSAAAAILRGATAGA